MLTPPEGASLFPGDSITIELVQPWYLQWLPSAKVRLMVDVNGRLHVAQMDEAV